MPGCCFTPGIKQWFKNLVRQIWKNFKVKVNGMSDLSPNPPILATPMQAWAQTGQPFAYVCQVVQGIVPLSFSGTGLPAGLSIDSQSGIITGVVAADGTYIAQITAANLDGSDTETLTITSAAYSFDLADLKAYLQIGGMAQDSMIQLLAASCHEWIETRLNILLRNQFVSEWLDGGEIYLWPHKRPVNALALVTDAWDWDSGGDNTVYPAKLIESGRIQRADTYGRALFGYVWIPGIKRWHVQYTAGYALVPPGLKLGIFQLIGRAWQKRAGEARGSAGGATINWEELAGSDVMKLLLNYSHRRVAAVAEKGNA
jgi:hypothetical protein